MDNNARNSPHPLDLYRLAVQHPLAEVAFVELAWSQLHGDATEPTLLREDFAGTCAVSSAWVASDPDRQAMAVEIHEPTAHWAAERFDDPDLHIVLSDVMAVHEPSVEVIVALNFSVMIYHSMSTLRDYLAHSLICLEPGGLLIMDLFGGPKMTQPSIQRRRIVPDEGGFMPFEYEWQQDGQDPATGRITCRIHFDLDFGERLDNAFVYDWRLWKPQELISLSEQAGFASSALWWSDPMQPGRYQPVQEAPANQDWVGYVVCQAPIADKG